VDEDIFLQMFTNPVRYNKNLTDTLSQKTMENSLKNPKDQAIDFLRMASSGKIRDAYRKYIADDFVHHNGHFKGDRESLMKAMEENHIQNPHKILDVKHALKDGDLVAIHSHVRMNPDDNRGVALVHIFRFQNGRVVELWDLGEPVPAETVNENGMF
jgi:predicted SnoaL-like aldol condensation-catalyzing enzyme